ncbi:MAG: hypothetical protein BRD30_07200 [Bacteroidetes bacterium QH_2_63_10]|nr:MAG: hypothetical protein BRD30_07200 [Bacteroidetes bacterium QH_2_63_10]
MAWYQYYEHTEPREVKGGIKAKSQRGAFGTTWWGERWEEVLKGFNLSNRLPRAKRYARKGQVLSIEVEEGAVAAEVQGSRADPYEVTIRLRPYDEAEWDKLIEAFRHQPYFAAALLAGEMPPEVEDVVERAGLDLFPEREADLETDCTCPDWSNPCKHIAAVYLLLAEEFDRDPFLLFRLRGLRQGALMDRIGGDVAADDLYGAVETPPSHATLPKQLGKFPLWRAEEPLIDALEPIYEAASVAGVELFEAEESFPDADE